MMRIRKGIAILLSLGMLFLCAAPIYAEEETETEATTIRVAFYPLEGFFEYDEDGNESGYGVDYLNELTKYANLQFEYIKADSWEGIATMLANDEVDIRLPVSVTTTQSPKYDYTSEEMLSTFHAIMCLKSRDDLYYKDYETFPALRIGITSSLLGKVGIGDYLDSIGVGENILFYDDYNSLLLALERGEIDGLVSNVMDYTSELKILDRFGIVDNCITTLKGNPKYVLINHAMTQLKLEEPTFQSTLYQKYYPERVWEPFTKEETQYIESKDVLKVGVYTDRRPVCYYDEDTKTYKGIAIDVADALSKKIGIPFEYHTIEAGTNLDNLAQYDLVMPSTANVDSSKYFVTNSILSSSINLAGKTDKVELERGDTIGLLSSMQGVKKVLLETGYYTIVEYATSEDGFNALKRGKIDCFAASSYVMDWELGHPKYGNLKILKYDAIPVVYGLAGNASDSILQSALNKSIARISEEEVSTAVRNNVQFLESDLTIGDFFYSNRHIIYGFILIFVLVLIAAYFYDKSQKAFIARIEESRKKEEEANKAKNDFLARMSHDMRTPLNVIIGMTGLAQENDNPPDTNTCLKKIDVSSGFLLGLINDVLDMEHLESGKVKIHEVPYSGEEFTDYIDSVIRPLCNKKNIHFEYTYTKPSKSFMVMQDKLRINQVYFNLLSNAVKFTPENGTVTMHSEIQYVGTNKVDITATIKDNGIGMNQAFMAHLFEPFTQESKETVKASEGTGLGLAIVKKLCDLMHMDIQCESEVGVGTTFIVHGVYDMASKEALEEREKNERCMKDSFSLKGKKFLVCEDHPLNQEIILRLLQKKGANAVVTKDGKEGLEAFENAERGTYDAILMDIRMPVMNGLDATKAIRALDREDAKEIPIIALSANAYPEDVEMSLSAGINAHISKPINPSVLYNTLEKYLKRE